jgi:cation transporter-like permease
MEESGKNRLDLRDLLLKEFDQAWAHYRHLENERSWLIGFMFTIVLGAIGWAVKIFNKTESVNANFSSMIIAAIVCVLGIAIYAAVSKVRFALRHYIKVWHFLRKEFYGKKYEELNRNLDIYCNRSIQIFVSNSAISNCVIWTVIIGSFLYLTSGLISRVIGGWSYFRFVRFDGFYTVIIAFLVAGLLFLMAMVFHYIQRAEAEAKATKDEGDIESPCGK